MAHSRGFTRGVVRGARRATSWAAIDLVVGGVDGSATLFSSLNAAGLAKRPFTIIRTYLNVLVHTDQGAATESWHTAVGLAVVSDQAAAIGVTAVPTPITDLGSDLWLLHRMQQGRIAFGDNTGFDHIPHAVDYDSKAMRKINDDQDLVLVVEGAVTGNGATMSIQGRFLIKES